MLIKWIGQNCILYSSVLINSIYSIVTRRRILFLTCRYTVQKKKKIIMKNVLKILTILLCTNAISIFAEEKHKGKLITHYLSIVKFKKKKKFYYESISFPSYISTLEDVESVKCTRNDRKRYDKTYNTKSTR